MGQQAEDVLGGASRRKGVGGSRFQLFHNSRLKALCEIERSRRDFPGAVSGAIDLAKLEVKIRSEWQEVLQNPSEYAAWADLFASKRQRPSDDPNAHGSRGDIVVAGTGEARPSFASG